MAIDTAQFSGWISLCKLYSARRVPKQLGTGIHDIASDALDPALNATESPKTPPPLPNLQYIFIVVAAVTLRGAAEHGPVRFDQ